MLTALASGALLGICAGLAPGPTGDLPAADAPKTRRPNVLLILVDDLKPALGAYGDTAAITPEMDRLCAGRRLGCLAADPGRSWPPLRPTAILVFMDVELRPYELLSPRSMLGPYRAPDYWKLPDDQPCELLFGRFYRSPSPSALHQIVAYLLWEALMGAARRSGGVALGAPLDAVLAEHSVVQPDVLYVSAARRSMVGDRIEGAPDLIVEVVSPKSARRDRVEKLRLYAEHGVKEYWIADPEEQQIDFFVNREGTFQVALAADDVYASPAFPEIRIDLLEFWKEVEARLP